VRREKRKNPGKGKVKITIWIFLCYQTKEQCFVTPAASAMPAVREDFGNAR
jgi:hypothetical protein